MFVFSKSEKCKHIFFQFTFELIMKSESALGLLFNNYPLKSYLIVWAEKKKLCSLTNEKQNKVPS